MGSESEKWSLAKGMFSAKFPLAKGIRSNHPPTHHHHHHHHHHTNTHTQRHMFSLGYYLLT